MIVTPIQARLSDFLPWRRRVQPKIFISYRRRGEGAGYGGRVADKLVEHFGAEQCFRDVEDIESGVDFVKTIQEAVGGCEVLIAVIGPDWLTQTNARGGRRLDDPRDFVRLEVASALERDIRVIPVLVGAADVPGEQQLPEPLKSLARRQVHELTDTRWDYDVGKLVEAIESMGIRRRSRSKPRVALAANWKVASGVMVAASLVVVTSVLTVYALNRDHVLPDSGLHSSVDVKAGEHAAERSSSKDERAAAMKVSLEQLAQSTAQASSVGTFTGINGRAQVSWVHQSVVYQAIVVTNGQRGSAIVNYVAPLTGTRVSVEQDLELVKNADGVFYVGANPRMAGTTIADPLYLRDIFKLGPLQNGTWTITAVGDHWEHLDTATTVPY
jgi:hypothetical protein